MAHDEDLGTCDDGLVRVYCRWCRFTESHGTQPQETHCEEDGRAHCTVSIIVVVCVQDTRHILDPSFPFDPNDILP